MTPGTLNLEFVSGDAYSHTIHFQDANGTALDVSAYTHRAQIRSSHAAATATDIAIDESAAATGDVRISLTAAQTRALRRGVFVWDMERELAGGEPQTVLRGTAAALPDVTREEVTP